MITEMLADMEEMEKAEAEAKAAAAAEAAQSDLEGQNGGQEGTEMKELNKDKLNVVSEAPTEEAATSVWQDDIAY